MHAQIAATSLCHAQEVKTLWCIGKHESTWQVNAAVLARFFFDLFVQVDGVLLQASNVWVAVQCVHSTGRVPCRTSRELLALDEHYICPTCLREVVQHRGAYDATTDYYNAC